MIQGVTERWHQLLRGDLQGGLEELLDDDVDFYSPIVYTPQQGKAITTRSLEAAGAPLPGTQADGAPEDPGAGRR